MQPCEVCGGMGVDAAGYCTRCRTYRGVSPTGGTPYGPPVSGGGYAPTSGAPYPTSGAAGYPQPQSGTGYPQPQSGPPAQSSAPPGGYPPGYQVQYQQFPGAAPPGAVPPAPAATRSRGLTIPLIALSATLVIIVVAIVVVAIVKSGGRKAVAGGGPSPGASALVDECVVGTWAITSDEEDVVMDEVGKVRFTGKGGEAKLKADGTGLIDYNKDGGTKFTATYKDQPVQLTITGTVTFEYRTLNGAMSFSHMQAKGELAMTVAGVAATTLPLEVTDDPAKYTCGGDSLTQTTTLQTVTMSRTSKDA